MSYERPLYVWQTPFQMSALPQYLCIFIRICCPSHNMRQLRWTFPPPPNPKRVIPWRCPWDLTRSEKRGTYARTCDDECARLHTPHRTKRSPNRKVSKIWLCHEWVSPRAMSFTSNVCVASAYIFLGYIWWWQSQLWCGICRCGSLRHPKWPKRQEGLIIHWTRSGLGGDKFAQGEQDRDAIGFNWFKSE